MSNQARQQPSNVLMERARHARQNLHMNGEFSAAQVVSDLMQALESWRGWAQFVYLGGRPVTLADDGDLRAAVCAAHDARVQEAGVYRVEPSDAPTDAIGHGRLLLNAYGRRCFNAGRESQAPELTRLTGELQIKDAAVEGALRRAERAEAHLALGDTPSQP